MAIPIKATLKVSSKAFTTGMKVATKAVGGLVSVAKMATLAVAGLTAAFTAIVLRQAAVIDRIGKVSKVTGVAAETLQKFSFAAELAGVSTDQAQVALRRFSRRLGEAQKGTGELLPALKRLGIETRNTDGTFKSAEEVLLELADGIKNTEGESAKLAIAFKAFDSEGAELVNTLKDGSEALQDVFNRAEALGGVLSATTIQAVEDFNDSFKELQTLVGGLTNTFVGALAPALDQVTKDFTDFLLAIAKEQGGIQNLGDFLKNEFLDIIKVIVTVVGTLINKIIELGRLVGKFELDPKIAEQYNKISDALDLIEQKAGKPFDFTGLVQGADVASDLIEALKTVGFDVTALEQMYANLGTLDRLSGATPFPTDDLQMFNESLAQALVLAAEVGDQTGIIAENQGINIEKILEYIESLKQATPLVQTITNDLEDQRTVWEKIIDYLKEGIVRVEDFQDAVLDMGQILENVATRLGTPMERLSKTIEDGLVKGVEIFEDTLTDAILTGKADFSDLGDHIKQVLAKAFVQRFISGPILALFGLAKGGPAKAGQPYIVGEEGPELFVPNQSGTVIPNHKLGASGGGAMMGGGVVNYNIQAVDAPSFQQLVARDPEFIYNVTRAGARRTPG